MSPHKERCDEKGYYIMKLSGGEQGSFQPGLKIALESRESRLVWNFYGGYELWKVPTAKLGLCGLKSCRCQRRKLLGLLSFSRCQSEGKREKEGFKSCG